MTKINNRINNRISNRISNKRNKGFTLLELVVILVILLIVLRTGVPGLRAFFSHMEISGALRTATLAMQSARYQALRLNKRVKLQLLEDRFLLMEKQGKYWKMFYAFEPVKNVSLRMSAFPVFSPYGTVGPLCSVYVENSRRRYKISISMAGRIKVTELEVP